MSDKTSLSNFFATYDRTVIPALAIALAIPFILDSLFGLRPPWPRGSTYITSFLELCVIIHCFFQPSISKKRISKRLGILTTLLTFIFFTYFLTYSLFVYDIPTSDGQLVAGFACTPDAVEFVLPELSSSCPFVSQEVVAAAQYDAHLIWTPFSIAMVETALFFLWTSFFLIATYIFASAIIFTQSQPTRTKKQDK